MVLIYLTVTGQVVFVMLADIKCFKWNSLVWLGTELIEVVDILITRLLFTEVLLELQQTLPIMFIETFLWIHILVLHDPGLAIALSDFLILICLYIPYASASFLIAWNYKVWLLGHHLLFHRYYSVCLSKHVLHPLVFACQLNILKLELSVLML